MFLSLDKEVLMGRLCNSNREGEVWDKGTIGRRWQRNKDGSREWFISSGLKISIPSLR